MADTILIVDPSGDRTAAPLALPAHRIVRVCSGSEALAGLYQRETVLLLIDGHLGRVDAEDLVGCARNVRPELPVAVMAEPEHMDRAMGVFHTAVTDYINKPVSPTAVSLLLQRSSQRKGQTSMNALGAHLAPVAHGIYNMLTALDGGFYQLESGLAEKMPQRVDAGLAVVRNYSSRLRRLVMDVLEYVRAEHIRTQPVHLPGVALSVLDAVQPAARRAGVRIAADISADAGWAAVDPLRFQAALERLLTAAVADTRRRASDGRPVIDFRLKPPSAGQLRIEIVLPAGLAEKSVDGADFDATLSRLGRFVACHLIRQQGGRVQGDEASPAMGWIIELPGAPEPLPHKRNEPAPGPSR